MAKEYSALDLADALEARACQEQNEDFAFELKSSALMLRLLIELRHGLPTITLRRKKAE